MRSVLVIFDTVVTYPYYSKERDFVDLEEKTSPRKLKVIAKDLEMYGFGIIEYFVRSESGFIIVIRAQACYVTGPPKY